MANTKNFNPAYSSVKSLFLQSPATSTNFAIDIVKQNTECRFEKVEMVENVTDTLPAGTLVVTDLNDIVSFIQKNDIQNIILQFFNGNSYTFPITSVSYINNAASDSEITLVAINFTNQHYTFLSKNSVNNLLGIKKPTVFGINELIVKLRTVCNAPTYGYNDFASNFFLYRPLIPYNSGEEAIPDNVIEFMQYLCNGAVNNKGDANFAFWTSFDGAMNFKSFERNLADDISAATVIDEVRSVAVFDGDQVTRNIDGRYYRKAYFAATNPAYQWISKNYYYIRKTPKYLDTNTVEVNLGLTGDALSDAIIESERNTTKNLTFHFQDDGQKYNIDVVSIYGRGTTAPKGGDNIFIDHPWGYFDGQLPTNDKSISNLLGNQYGTEKSYYNMVLMGESGYMPYLDSPDMWKNMFDMTPIHPHYPDDKDLPATSTSLGINGIDTYLQKVIDIRYDVFQSTLTGASEDRLKKLREIEAQNFVMYSLCCMGKQPEQDFFALLQRYEPDSVSGISGSVPGNAKKYRYKWNKLKFNAIYGACGPAGMSGSSGGSGGSSGAASYYFHQLENWSLDSVASSATQDDTWAINVNERGLTSSYLPPGWSPSNIPSGFQYRAIGTNGSATPPDSADIFHIVKMYQIPLTTLLSESGNQVYPEYQNKFLSYFWAENVVDGSCQTTSTTVNGNNQ
jgi:hypothetical protein